MYLKILNFILLSVLISACDVSGSDLNKDFNNKQEDSNPMSKNVSRLSYLEAKKLSIGFLGADLTDENKKNLLTLETKSKNHQEVNALFVLTLMRFYDGNNVEKNEAIRVFYKLAELGHPYAALEFVKYSKSNVNNFNLVKKINKLSTEQLNKKNHDYLYLAINHNVNAAYYYYAEYLLDDLNNSAKLNSESFKILDEQKKIVEHLFLNTSSYLGNVPDLNVFLIYTKLFMSKKLEYEDIVKVKALSNFFKQVESIYSEEKSSSDYFELERALTKIDQSYSLISDDDKDVKTYIDKIQSTPKVFISDWIEMEVDYK